MMNTFVWFTFSNFMIEKNISKVMSYLSLPFYPIWVESKILRPSKKISLQIKSLFPSLIQPNQGNGFSSLFLFSLSPYYFQSKYSLRLCLVVINRRKEKRKGERKGNQKEKRKEKTFSFGVFGYRMERK